MVSLHPRRKSLLATAVFVTTLALLLSAAATAQQVTITHLSQGGAVMNLLNDLAVWFTEENPQIAVEIRPASVDEITVMIAGGVPIDTSDGFGQRIAPVSEALLDFMPVLERDPDLSLDSFVTTTVRESVLGGRLVALPWQAQPWLTFYNATLLDERGVQTPVALGDDWTWESVITAGRALTHDENGDGVPEIWGTTLSSDLLRAAVWVHHAGGALFDKEVESTRPTMMTPAVNTAFSWMQSLGNEYGIMDISGVNHYTQGSNHFRGGRLGLNLNPSATYFFSSLREVPFEWDVARLPRGPVNDATAVGGTSLQIFADTKNMDAAWKWVKFVATDARAVEHMAATTGRVPAYIPVLPVYIEALDGVIGNMDVVLDYIMDPATRPRDFNKYYGAVTGAVNPILDRMLRGEISVPEAQEQAQHAAEVAMELR